MTHQDLVTWTALSVFFSAQLVLLALLLQSLASGSGVIGTISAMGLFVTLVSFIVVTRSNYYLAAYLRLARERAHSDDSAIFNVKPPPSMSARWALIMLHLVFFVIWGVLTFAYFYVTYFRPVV